MHSLYLMVQTAGVQLLSRHGMNLRYESSTLILMRSWVALSFKVCESVSLRVSEASVKPDQISTCSIYKGINALHWPNNMNYRLILTQYCQVPTIAVLHWPSTHYTASSPRNAQLSQLDLVSNLISQKFWRSFRLILCVRGECLWPILLNFVDRFHFLFCPRYLIYIYHCFGCWPH